MKSLTFTLVLSAFSLLATAQTFDEKSFADVIQSFKTDIIGYLKTNTAPDYTFTYNGAVVDAKALITRFETNKVSNWTVTNLKVRQYGTAAFATGTVNHVYSKVDGSTLNFTDLFSYTFAYQGGKWLCLGGQHSDVPLDFTEKSLQDMSNRILADFRKYMQEEVSPDIRITLAEGQVTNHKDMIGLLPALQITKWSLSDVKISHFGNMAVATGINNHDVLNVKANTTTHFTVRFTYTYAYINGKWMWMQWQHTHIVPMQTLDEEAAIKKALDDESTAFFAGNKEAFMKIWNLNPKTIFVWSESNGRVNMMNNEQLQAYATNTLKPSGATFVKSNHRISIKGNIAITDYDQITTNADGTNWKQHNVAILEKKNGEWKYIGASVHNIPNSDVPSDRNKGQTIQKGNLVGIRTITVELKPNVTMDQVLDFYNTKWIPDADKYFGWKFFVSKCLRGTACAENKLIMIAHFKTEAARDKYFKMAEGGKDLNELGQKAWAQFAPTNDAIKELATVKEEWADWVIK